MTITYHSGKRIQGLSTDTVQTPNLNEDFTSYATQGSADTAWAYTNSTYMRVDITNDYLAYNGIYNNSSSVYASSYDLQTALGSGNNASDTAWVLRFKFNNTTVNNDGAIWCGLRTVSNQLTTATSDSLGVMIYAASPNVSNWGISSFSSDNAGITIGTQYDTTLTYSSNKTLYVEIKRTTATSLTINLYSDSNYSSLLYTNTQTIASTITGLRYVTFQNSNHGTGVTSYSLTGFIDDVKFWNGITSLNSKPTNVPSGTRFEETDTRKIYFADGTNYVVTPDGLGSAANGTNTGGVTQNSAGKLGSYSYSYDGVDDYTALSVSSLSTSLANTQTVSYSFWFNANSFANTFALVEPNKSTTSGEYTGLAILYYQPDNKFYIYPEYCYACGAGGVGGVEVSSTTLRTDLGISSTGTWYHMVVTYDGSGATNTNKLKVYVNGVQKTLGATTGTFPSTLYYGSYTTFFNLGKATGFSYYNGKMDELSIWNRALSSTEIGYLYNSGTGRTIPQAVTDNGLSTTGLKAYYTFEETTGNLINHAVTSPVWSLKA